MIRIVTLLLAIALTHVATAEQELLTNGDFEQGLTGWNPFWSRSGGGEVGIDTAEAHQGDQAVHIQYDGNEDWSFPQSKSLAVQPGDIYQLTGWLRIQGEGSASLSVILYDRQGKSLSWDFGGRPHSHGEQWRHVQRRFVVPQEGATILPRLMGHGAAQIWLDDVSLVKTGSVRELQTRELPESLSIESVSLLVTFDPRQATITLLDKRTGRQFTQHPAPTLMVLEAASTDNQITFKLLKPDDVLTVDGTIRLEADKPEFVVELSADGEMRQPLRFPSAFATAAGQFLILPVNEGISYPVDDASLPAMSYHLIGGHGLCMAFWGCTDLRQSLMAIVETPDDARVAVPRIGGNLCLAPQWDAQKGQFGPQRRIRYISLDQGGYVAMCKRYRQYAQQIGRFKTLAQKREENPDVDRLIGAVNVWCWDRPGDEMCREMQELGIDRILWSNRCAAGTDQTHERDGGAHQPLRHLPGRAESGEFSQAAWRPSRLDHRSLARRH